MLLTHEGDECDEGNGGGGGGGGVLGDCDSSLSYVVVS